METNEKKEKDLDLIDLTKEVLAMVGHLLAFLWTYILLIFRLNIRYWYIILIFFVLSIFAFIHIAFMKPRIQAEFVVHMVGVNYGELQDRVRTLGLKLNPFNNNEAFAKTLKLQKEDVKAIRSVDSHLCLDINKDGLRDRICEDESEIDSTMQIVRYELCIRMTAHGLANFMGIQKNMLAYFNQNPELIAMCDRYVKTHEKEIRLLENEMGNLSHIEEGPNPIMQVGEDGVITSRSGDTRDKMELINRSIATELGLGTQRYPVRAVSDVLIREPKSKFRVAIECIFSCYLIAVLLIVLIDNYSKIKDFVRSSRTEKRQES